MTAPIMESKPKPPRAECCCVAKEANWLEYLGG
jgi:hypothetical protein